MKRLPGHLPGLPTYLACVAMISCGAAGSERVTDPNDVFSVEVPAGWAKEADSEGDFSAVTLTSGRGPKIIVRFTSRLLTAEERAADREGLLMSMLTTWVDSLEREGNKIISEGRTDPLVPGWRTFAIVSATESNERITLAWGTVVGDRNYSVLALTRDSDSSPALSATLMSVVTSFRVLDAD